MQEAYLSKKLSTDPPRWDQHVRQKAAILRSWADESGDTAMHREAEQWERNAATVDRVMAKLEAIAPGQCPWNRAGGAS